MFIYDIEMYPNFFLVGFYNVADKITQTFEISQRKNDTLDLINFLRNQKGCVLIGFNSLTYDYPMLHYFILQYNKHSDTKGLVNSLYRKSLKLGIDMRNGGYRSKIAKPLFKNIDLFLINHFNNKAKMVSLKELEFTLRMKNIQELPYAFDRPLDSQQMDEVIVYNKNDIDATLLLYEKCIEKIEFRERMSKIYNIDFTNHNDVKIGEEILIDALCKQLGWDKKDVKQMRTHRSEMKISDFILPYISFRSREFSVFLEWWKTKIIYETKGQFSKILLEEVAPILPYCQRDFVSRNTKLEKLNIFYKNFRYDFGTGGIHGILRPGVWKTNDKYELILVDVSSFYPMSASKNGWSPAHFSTELFVKVIDILYGQRMAGKEINDMQIVSAIKLALNGALYGKSNDKYSCMYDPQFMMTICINCQLLMVMLAESFADEMFEIVQINTDGIFVYIEKEKRHILDKICNDWMKLTKLKLDYDHFDLIAQKDCNNYIARYTNGYIKRKGAAFNHENLELHKNHSALVVKKAVEAYFLFGSDISKFIKEHSLSNKNLYDFFLRAKLSNKDHKLYGVIGEQRHRLQKITRYFVAKEGMYLQKHMPPLKGKIEERIGAIEKGYQVMPCNNLGNFIPQEVRNNLNFDYYITKAKNIINSVEKC